MEWMAVVKCKVSKGFTEKVKVELWHPGCLTAPCRCGREEWFLAGSFRKCRSRRESVPLSWEES